jgi:hypothetical protein
MGDAAELVSFGIWDPEFKDLISIIGPDGYMHQTFPLLDYVKSVAGPNDIIVEIRVRPVQPQTAPYPAPYRSDAP